MEPHLLDPSMFVYLSRETEPWPLKLRNDTILPLKFYQVVCIDSTQSYGSDDSPNPKAKSKLSTICHPNHPLTIPGMSPSQVAKSFNWSVTGLVWGLGSIC